jgi:hypothetical protein
MILRDVQRILLNIVLGPLLGCLVVMASGTIFPLHIAGAMQWSLTDPLFSESNRELLIMGYLFGAPLALLSGIVTTIIAHFTRSSFRRVLYSTLAGGLCGALMVSLLLGLWNVIKSDFVQLASLPIVAGTFASLVCTLLIERFGARRRQTSVPPH